MALDPDSIRAEALDLLAMCRQRRGGGDATDPVDAGRLDPAVRLAGHRPLRRQVATVAERGRTVRDRAARHRDGSGQHPRGSDLHPRARHGRITVDHQSVAYQFAAEPDCRGPSGLRARDAAVAQGPGQRHPRPARGAPVSARAAASTSRDTARARRWRHCSARISRTRPTHLRASRTRPTSSRSRSPATTTTPWTSRASSPTRVSRSG